MYIVSVHTEEIKLDVEVSVEIESGCRLVEVEAWGESGWRLRLGAREAHTLPWPGTADSLLSSPPPPVLTQSNVDTAEGSSMNLVQR